MEGIRDCIVSFSRCEKLIMSKMEYTVVCVTSLVLTGTATPSLFILIGFSHPDFHVG
jgi:hypothetical protein